VTEQLDEKEIIATLVRIAEEESVFGIEVAVRPEQANGTAGGRPDRKYAIRMAQAVMAGDFVAAQPVAGPELPVEHDRSSDGPAQAAPPPVIVRSPLVGIFHRGLEPGEPPLVDVGSRVRAGQTLCCVESLKVSREVSSDTTGVVLEVLVGDEEPVDYGRPLFSIQPSSDEE